MVAIYTEHKNDKSSQTQCLAISLDQGRTFTKYEGNPVLDLQTPDFRDPKVQWVDGHWLMTIALPDLHQISFYSSPNLKEWTHLSNFGPAAETGGCWECPDLFKLGNKWVLIVSLNPGGYQIGSGTQYFIGEWNGKEFIADDIETRWLDYGRDNYAGVTFNDAPNGKRIFLGWMSNWDYAGKVPTDPWRSAMTLPRELSLEGDRLVQKVLLNKELPTIKFSTSGGNVRISESADCFIEVGLSDGKIFMDAKNTWYEDLKFHRQEITADKEIVDFEIYIDRGSMELFADGGKVSITNLLFVETALSTVSSEGELLNLEVINLA
jgi:sucrose-6-phosphate hydrolase SacC (GH32 family)